MIMHFIRLIFELVPYLKNAFLWLVGYLMMPFDIVLNFFAGKFSTIHHPLKWVLCKNKIGPFSNVSRAKKIIKPALIVICVLWMVLGCFSFIQLSIPNLKKRTELRGEGNSPITFENSETFFDDENDCYIEDVALISYIPKGLLYDQSIISGFGSYLVRFKTADGKFVYATLCNTGKDRREFEEKLQEVLSDTSFKAGEYKINGRFKIYSNKDDSYAQMAYIRYSGKNPLSHKLINYIIYIQDEYATYEDYVEDESGRYAFNLIVCIMSGMELLALALLVPTMIHSRKMDCLGGDRKCNVTEFDDDTQLLLDNSSPVRIYDGNRSKRGRKLKEFCYEGYEMNLIKTCYFRRTTKGYRVFAAITPEQLNLNLTESKIDDIMELREYFKCDRLLSDEEVNYIQELARSVEKSGEGEGSELIFCYRGWNSKISVKRETAWTDFANTLFDLAVNGSNYSLNTPQ